MTIINLISNFHEFRINGIAPKSGSGEVTIQEKTETILNFDSNGESTPIYKTTYEFKILTVTGDLVDLPAQVENTYIAMNNSHNKAELAKKACEDTGRTDILVLKDYENISDEESKIIANVLSMVKIDESTPV